MITKKIGLARKFKPWCLGSINSFKTTMLDLERVRTN